MAETVTIPKPPSDVADALKASPKAAAKLLHDIRDLIFETAGTLAEVGTISESLKWGEPSYATVRPRSGTPVRLGWDEAGKSISLFVHCQTSLVKEWRQHYSDQLDLIGNRELCLPVASPPSRDILRHCIAMALTYHVRKKPQ